MENKKLCPHCKLEVDPKASRCPHCQGKIYIWTLGRKLMFLLIILFASSIFVAMFNSDVKLSDQSNAVARKIDPVKLEADKKRLGELKNKFDYKYDEFNKIGWYVPKSQTVGNTYNQKFLKVLVNNSGYIYLQSVYYASDWLFHTRIEVKIGDSIYKSEDVPTYNKDNETDIGGGSIWEYVSYTSGKDNGIIKAIAESGDATIKVRYVGRQSIFDMNLSKRDQQAIKDSYELSQLIKEIESAK